MTAAGSGEGIALDCILGRSDSLRAEVFFRATLPPGVDAAGATLTGTLVGPECRRAITLPVTAKLAAVRGGDVSGTPDALVARAILTEPSYWTPELPNRYRLEARLEAAGRELATWRRPLGLRRLGVRGRSLWLDGRRYVPRGLVATDAVDIAALRAAGLAAVVADPSEPFLDRCDAEGVAVIGLLAEACGKPLDVAAATAAVARWAWHPAVLAAVVPHDAAADATPALTAAIRGRRDTVLLGREVDGSEPSVEVVDGIDLLVVALPAGGLPHDAWRAAPLAVPLLARRAGETGAAPEPSRRGCDALQAALAAWRACGAPGPQPDWAGYLVG
ncbi:MAG: hypothetical protein ACKOCX_09600 [Planctomycetota bacterium]